VHPSGELSVNRLVSEMSSKPTPVTWNDTEIGDLGWPWTTQWSLFCVISPKVAGEFDARCLCGSWTSGLIKYCKATPEILYIATRSLYRISGYTSRATRRQLMLPSSECERHKRNADGSVHGLTQEECADSNNN